MRLLSCLLILFLSLSSAFSQEVTYQGPDGKTYVNLRSKQPKETPNDSGYDPDLLIPHWNPATDKWGYIRRATKELVVSHQFKNAGRFDHGFAIAIAWTADGKGEDVFRVDATGQVQCLFQDKKNLGSTLDKHRYDDYLFLRTEDRILCFGANGKMLLDTIIKGHYRRMTLPHGGVYTLLSRGKMQFIDFEKGVLATWDTSRYSIKAPAVYPGNETPWLGFYPIHDRKTDLHGILNHRGQVVVPMEWEWRATPALFESMGEEFKLYAPCADSLFLGFRNGHYYLLHLDGRKLFEYGDTIYPSPQGHWAYRQRGWLKVHYYAPDWGWAEAYCDLSGEIMYRWQGSFIQLMDSARIFSAIRGENNIYDLNSHEWIEAKSLKTGDNLMPVASMTEDGKVAWIMTDIYEGTKGAIDAFGKVVVPFRYNTIVGTQNHPQQYYTIQALGRNEGQDVKAYYDLNGNMLFGQEFLLARFYNPKPGQVVEGTLISDDRRNIHPARPGDDCDIHPYFREGEFHPNMLLYIEEYVTRSEIAKGYIDRYGYRYY